MNDRRGLPTTLGLNAAEAAPHRFRTFLEAETAKFRMCREAREHLANR